LIVGEVFAKFSANKDPLIKELQKELGEQWLQINVNLGIDFLAIYDQDRQLLVKEQSFEQAFDQYFFHILDKRLYTSNESSEPQQFIFCQSICYFVVVEPFITSNGREGFYSSAQNISETLSSYYNFTSENIGILIAGDNLTEQQDEKYFSAWQLRPWAISNYDAVFPVIQSYSHQQEFSTNTENNLFNYHDKRYLIKSIQLNGIELLGHLVHFVSVSDKTSDYDVLSGNIKRGFIFGFIALLFSSLMVRRAIRNPINKLKEIGKALHLIPQKEFSKAMEQLDNHGENLDEISSLETNTRVVVKKLQDLYRELDDKNISLNDQVTALSRSRAFLTRLFENSHVFIVTQNFNGEILSSNKKFDSLFLNRSKSFSRLLRGLNEIDEFQKQIELLKFHQINVFQQEINSVDNNSKNINISWTHALVDDEHGDEIVLSVGVDQTQQKNAENNLRWVANHDSLTGIGNRRAFHLAFKEMLDNEEKGVLLFIDVNKFKQINDIYNHSAGDQVLIDIAAKLRSMVRSSDHVNRFAGDEFTVLLKDTTKEELPTYLDKISGKLNTTLKLSNGQTINYSVSIGAACFPENNDDEETITVNADLAMYNAKKKGLGYWHIYDEQDERVAQLKHDHDIMLSIKYALKNKTFSLAFQPILNIKNNDISHYEALLRLRNEEGGFVSPAFFIPLAEKTGEIRFIDEWVVENCLQTLSQVNQAGCKLNFSINISTPTLQAIDFPEFLFEKVKKYDVDPSSILIELTETAYIENFHQVLKNLTLISKFGIKLALDDFGVGFSSFDYLKKLPLDFVKLDGSYIKNIERNKDDQVFVKSLTQLVKAFGMKTIAEYVENEAILDMVGDLGVTYAQGYHISKPIRRKDFLENLEKKYPLLSITSKQTDS